MIKLLLYFINRDFGKFEANKGLFFVKLVNVIYIIIIILYLYYIIYYYNIIFKAPTMKTSNEQPPSTETQNGILALNIPIEELLGSVTTYNNVEGSDNKSQQLRTSARVFKKMKLDTSTTVAPLTPDKKESNVKEDYKLDMKKRIWSPEEKNLFFEALNEFGKDFDSIQNYISNKLKKRGFPESAIKTRDQIKHIYHRTFHKISKHLKFGSGK